MGRGPREIRTTAPFNISMKKTMYPIQLTVGCYYWHYASFPRVHQMDTTPPTPGDCTTLMKHQRDVSYFWRHIHPHTLALTQVFCSFARPSCVFRDSTAVAPPKPMFEYDAPYDATGGD